MGRNKTYKIWLVVHLFFFRVFSVFRGSLIVSLRQTYE
jgi:hypothetical protein